MPIPKQYLLFDSHHPFQHKLGVVKNLHHWGENIQTSTEAKNRKDKDLKFSEFEILRTTQVVHQHGESRTRTMDKTENRSQDWSTNLVIPYMAGMRPDCLQYTGSFHTFSLQHHVASPQECESRFSRFFYTFAVLFFDSTFSVFIFITL